MRLNIIRNCFPIFLRVCVPRTAEAMKGSFEASQMEPCNGIPNETDTQNGVL